MCRIEGRIQNKVEMLQRGKDRIARDISPLRNKAELVLLSIAPTLQFATPYEYQA